MNATQLLAHFDRLSETAGAIDKLRGLILGLAVSGKLIPQFEGDLSAADALIAARKHLQAQAVVTKKVVWKPSEAVASKEVPATLPLNWIPARLNDTGFYVNGLAFKPSDWKSSGLPIIRIQNLTDPLKEFNFAEGDFPEEVIVRNGDLLVSWSATLEAFSWTRGVGVLNQHIFRVIPVEQLTDRRFLHLLLRNAIRELGASTHAHGLTMTHINRGPFLAHLVLIPPLAEQHRIVAKVDELMVLCDQLEAAQQERERRRDRLAAASLQRLNQPAADTTPEDQREHARFHLHHLRRLTTRPEHIKAMRQTILNLAVLGSLSESKDWALHSRPLKAAATLQNGYAFKSEWFAKSGIRLLRNTNVSHGVIRWDELACLPVEQAGEFERFTLIEGDVVLSLDRPFIGTGTKVARVHATDLPCLLLQRVGRFQLNPNLLTPDYLVLWIESPQFTDQIDPGRSNGVPHISSKQVENAEIFLPPLAEQQRIVAKVDELMALCDQLEAQLRITQTDSRRLLEAVLEAALTA